MATTDPELSGVYLEGYFPVETQPDFSGLYIEGYFPLQMSPTLSGIYIEYTPNSSETIQVTLPVPGVLTYNITVGVPIAPITFQCDDPDGGSTTLDLQSGALPAGLVLDRVLPTAVAVPFNTVISGTPTVGGTFNPIYTNDDGIGSKAALTLQFNVAAAPGGGLPTGTGGGDAPLYMYGILNQRLRFPS